MKFIEDARS